jgi:hypothetical protein
MPYPSRTPTVSLADPAGISSFDNCKPERLITNFALRTIPAPPGQLHVWLGGMMIFKSFFSNM